MSASFSNWWQEGFFIVLMAGCFAGIIYAICTWDRDKGKR